MKRWTKSVALALSLSIAVASIPRAHAATPSEKATAEQDFEEARKLMSDGKYAEACIKFEESQRLDPGMATEYRLAECYEALGRTATAWLMFIDVADQADQQKMPDRAKVARERAAKLQPKLARIAITPTTPELTDLKVVRDGEEIKRTLWGQPIPVDPGDHTVEVSAPGKKTWKTTVKAEASVTQTVTVPALEDAGAGGAATTTGGAATTTTTATTGAATTTTTNPEPMSTKDETPSSWPMQKTWAIVAGGTGVVLLGVGAAMYFSGKSAFDSTSSHCNAANICDQQGIDDRSSANGKAKLGSILATVGVVGLAAGAVLWFTAPTSSSSSTTTASSSPSFRVGVTPYGAILQGQF